MLKVIKSILYITRFLQCAGQTAEYGHFRQDLGCGKAENPGAGGQKRSGDGLRGHAMQSGQCAAPDEILMKLSSIIY